MMTFNLCTAVDALSMSIVQVLDLPCRTRSSIPETDVEGANGVDDADPSADGNFLTRYICPWFCADNENRRTRRAPASFS